MSENIVGRRTGSFKGNNTNLNSCLVGQSNVVSASREEHTHESLPLLPFPQDCTSKGNYSRSKRLIVLLACLCLVLSVILLQKLTQHTQSLMLKGMNQEIGTSFVELQDSRISMVTDGILMFDYDKIENVFQRSFIKVVSQLIGEITLEQKAPLDIYVSGLEGKCEVAKAIISSADLSTRDKVKSAFRLATEIDVLEEPLQDIISKLISHDNERYGSLIISGKIVIKWQSRMRVSRSIRINQSLPLDRFNIEPKVQINDILISRNQENPSWIDMDIQLIINQVSPLYLEIQPINWSVFLKDCGDSNRKIGRWSTGSIVLLPEKKTIFNATGVLHEIDNSLLQVCQDSGVSNINRAIKDALDQAAIAIYVKADEDEVNESHLPKWLLYMLTKFEFKVLLQQSPHSLKDRTQFKNLIVNYFEVDVVPNEDITTFELLLNSRLFMELYVPMINLDFSISQFEFIGNFIENEEIITIKLLSNSTVISVRHHHHNYDVLFDSNRIEVEMNNPKAIGRLLDEHVWGAVNHSFQIDATLEISLECSLFSTTLRDLRIPQFSLKEKKETPHLENILKNSNASVEQLTYLGSTSDSLQGIIDISFYNPINNFAFKMPESTVSFTLGYKNLRLANITIIEAQIANGSCGQMSIPFEINVDASESWSALQDFLNRLIPGREDLCLAVTGALDILSLEPLGTLLQHVTIECMRLAPYVFSQSDISTDTQSYRSPFVIELIAHLIGSYIQFTIYNPFSNLRLGIWLYRSIATYEGNLIARTTRRQYFEVSSGVTQSPRIPVSIENRAAMDLLRNALNSELRVGVEADFRLQIDQFVLPLSYNDTDTTFKVRL